VASIIVKKILAAPAALVAAESGANILPMDMTIVIMDIRTLRIVINGNK